MNALGIPGAVVHALNVLMGSFVAGLALGVAVVTLAVLHTLHGMRGTR